MQPIKIFDRESVIREAKVPHGCGRSARRLSSGNHWMHVWGDTSYYHSLDIIHSWFIILLMLADEYAMPICSKHIETLQLSSIGGWERNFVSTLLPQF